MFLSEKGWHLERQNLSQVNGLQQHKEPENEQHETEQQEAPCDLEHLCNAGDHELPGNRPQNQLPSVDLKAEKKGDKLQGHVDLPDTEKNVLFLAIEVAMRKSMSRTLVHLIST